MKGEKFLSYQNIILYLKLWNLHKKIILVDQLFFFLSQQHQKHYIYQKHAQVSVQCAILEVMGKTIFFLLYKIWLLKNVVLLH